MPQGLLLLPRLSPACSVVVAVAVAVVVVVVVVVVVTPAAFSQSCSSQNHHVFQTIGANTP
jgi:hypothetical protein